LALAAGRGGARPVRSAAPPGSAPVLKALGHDPLDLDTLAVRSGLTLDALYAILLPLELDGHVSRLPGGRFQRL
jgi:DNA processing protein